MGMNDINSLAHKKWNCKYHILCLQWYFQSYNQKTKTAFVSNEDTTGIGKCHRKPKVG